jgi:D-galactarolactone cycloisomerase
MKITSIEARPLASPLQERLRWGAMTVGVKGGIVVRIRTDEGLEGIGEAGFSAEFFPTVGPVIHQLAPLILGEDPRDIGALWQRMFDATHMWGRRGVETYALSGIDIALWDLMGKITGQPVYRLLGGCKSRVRAYLAPSLKADEETIAECVQAVADGATAVKLRLGPEATAGVRLVSGVREAVGDRLELMVDANMAFDRRTALEVARELERLDVSWFEEPILSRSLSQYVEDHSWLADRVSMRLSGGESLFTRYEYLELLERRTFDVLQPDCTGVGGISEAKRVADMASAWNLTCVPHIASSSGTGIALAAGLHLILACQNAPLIEFDPYGGPGWDGLLVEPLAVRNGWVEAPDAPGLGVELTPDAFERFDVAAVESAA